MGRLVGGDSGSVHLATVVPSDTTPGPTPTDTLGTNWLPATRNRVPIPGILTAAASDLVSFIPLAISYACRVDLEIGWACFWTLP